MNTNYETPPAARRKWRRPLWVVAGVALCASLAWVWLGGSRAVGPELASFEARRGDFLISIVEGGTIEAVNEVVVRSEFEGTARIISIVREGSYVHKGDLVVELDSSAAQDQVNQQEISYERAQFSVLQAEEQLKIQRSVADSEIQAAELKLRFAQIDLDKYTKGDRDQARRNGEIEITNVVQNLEIAKDRLRWTKQLYTNGWETKTKLDQDELAVSEGLLKQEQAEKALWMLKTFDEPKKEETLQAAVEEATQNLGRVKLQAERRLAQFQADVESQKNTLALSERKLERDKKQLASCRIIAPQDGLVVYAGGNNRFSSESMIEEGAVIRNRQELIKLPDVSSMKLQVKIHEAHINNIRRGQQAFVVLDSMPDRRFQGQVEKVGLVPDSQSRFGNPNLKLYATEIVITDKLPDIKPGVSARAEIIVTNLSDVITVPIQAVTTRRGQQVVFMAETPPRPQPVTVGLYSTKFIEVSAGLKAGDRVLLAPPFDKEGKDLGGGVLARGEKVPTNTNALRPLPGGRVDDNAPGSDGGPGNRPRLSREEMIKLFDKDGDGQLNEAERAAMQAARGGRGNGGGPRLGADESVRPANANAAGQPAETDRPRPRERPAAESTRTNESAARR